LNHASSPFCFSYFWIGPRVFALVGLDWDPPCLCFPPSWDVRCISPSPAISWDVSLTNFLTGLAWTMILRISASQGSWDYKHEPPCLAPSAFCFHLILSRVSCFLLIASLLPSLSM
jgi:hypothetical protein